MNIMNMNTSTTKTSESSSSSSSSTNNNNNHNDDFQVPSLTKPSSTESSTSMSLNHYIVQNDNKNDDKNDDVNDDVNDVEMIINLNQQGQNNNNNNKEVEDSIEVQRIGIVERNTVQDQSNDKNDNQQMIVDDSNEDENDIFQDVDNKNNNMNSTKIKVPLNNNEDDEEGGGDDDESHSQTTTNNRSTISKSSSYDNNDDDDNKNQSDMQQLNDYFDHVAETQREILERFYTAAVENPCKALRCTNPLEAWQSCNFLIHQDEENNAVKQSITNSSRPSFEFDPFHRDIIGPKSCEYCNAKTTVECDPTICKRPKLFMKRKTKPFQNERYKK